MFKISGIKSISVNQFRPFNYKRSISLNCQVKRDLFDQQPNEIRQMLIAQAGFIADAIAKQSSFFHFHLPPYISLFTSEDGIVSEHPVPKRNRVQNVGGGVGRAIIPNLLADIIRKLDELEYSAIPAVAVSASLIRYLAACNLIASLPPPEGNDRYIPELEKMESSSCEFFPEWVFVDSKGRMLVDTLREAEICVERMQAYLKVLQTAFALDPNISAYSDYASLHNSMTAQLICQGRQLAHLQTLEIIRVIRERAKQNRLNRGLSLSLPYFDDQALLMSLYPLEVIPPGRILFESAFVVDAARKGKGVVTNDFRFSPTTRQNLLDELDLLEKSFEFENRFISIGMIFENLNIHESTSVEQRRRATD